MYNNKNLNTILKNERGSITILVVVAMLFVLIVLSSAYINISNKKISQERNIEKIQNEYVEDANTQMEEKYQEILAAQEGKENQENKDNQTNNETQDN